MTRTREPIVIALSKGRILEQTLPLLAAAGVQMSEDPEKTRKLVIDTSRDDVKVVIVRATDVPTYVQHGAADIGVAGKDVLMEHGGAGLYEPLDLKIAQCRLMVAGWPDTDLTQDRLRIATKFVHVTEQYYASLGRQVELVKLYGSMELAPIVGLADAIVDLVDTGNTLRANGLEPLELITHISSRLIVNKAASKMKHERIQQLVTDLDAAVRARESAPGETIA